MGRLSGRPFCDLPSGRVSCALQQARVQQLIPFVRARFAPPGYPQLGGASFYSSPGSNVSDRPSGLFSVTEHSSGGITIAWAQPSSSRGPRKAVIKACAVIAQGTGWDFEVRNDSDEVVTTDSRIRDRCKQSRMP
jgi:hypothetical protein